MANFILVTGGHHSSAIPLIKVLIKNNFKVKFIGHKYASVLNNFTSSEYREIKSLNIPYINLISPKFYRVSGVFKYLKIIKSILYCLFLFIADRPKLIVSYGGYLAVPVVIAAKLLFIKVVTHEQTLTVGLANKIIQFFADIVFISWKEHTYSHKKFIFVGLPLRDEILNANKRVLSKNYKINTIFIQGGKQGSHTLNSFVFNNIKKLTKDFIIYHQTSKHSANNDHTISKKYKKLYKNKYFPFEFLFGSAYTQVLNNADLVLSRSGAHIVYEMSYLKIPTIFVPISWASQNEQYINAKVAIKYTPSVIINESDLNYKNFKNSLIQLRKIIPNKYLKKVEANSTDVMFTHIKKLL